MLDEVYVVATECSGSLRAIGELVAGGFRGMGGQQRAAQVCTAAGNANLANGDD
jgi:hypothetical protein